MVQETAKTAKTPHGVSQSPFATGIQVASDRKTATKKSPFNLNKATNKHQPMLLGSTSGAAFTLGPSLREPTGPAALWSLPTFKQTWPQPLLLWRAERFC